MTFHFAVSFLQLNLDLFLLSKLVQFPSCHAVVLYSVFVFQTIPVLSFGVMFCGCRVMRNLGGGGGGILVIWFSSSRKILSPQSCHVSRSGVKREMQMSVNFRGLKY